MPLSAKRILIAPLDWGLGHTTRCIPIIREIRRLGHNILFAGTPDQQAFIKQTFPDLDTRFLNGYRVRYSRHALMFTLLWQIPRLLKTIQAEHEWMLRIVEEESVDGIISDNRYGLWHPSKPSIILTHQPNIITGMGGRADAGIRKMHYKYLSRFRSVWIPDYPGTPNLAGRLSHPDQIPPNTQYIGPLSQFTDTETARVRGSTGEGMNEGHILILLSGPEPQRTVLADKLWSQVQEFKRDIVFVEGSAGASRQTIPPHIRHVSLATASDLQPLLEKASIVICRSGYSTLMDLATLGKPAILIPTPGQTEQEYLAQYLSAKGHAIARSQSTFFISEAIDKAKELKPFERGDAGDLLRPILNSWIQTL
jgi:UDP:flavonoid glycosyltransferase YjiC (YdhE family)